MLFRIPMTEAGEKVAGESAEGVLRAFSAGAGKLSWDLGSRVLSFALSILVARKLGAQGFGTYAVSFDDGELKTVSPKGAAGSARLQTVAGEHRLKLWCVDPGLVWLKVEVVRGKAAPAKPL